MATKIRDNFIDDIAHSISQDKGTVDELRLNSLATRLRGTGQPQPPIPPVPIKPFGGQPFLKPQPPIPPVSEGRTSSMPSFHTPEGKLRPLSADRTAYWVEEEKAWYPVKKEPTLFGLTKTQREARVGEPGILEAYGQKRREEATGLERVAITPIKGIGVSATDIASVVALGYGTYQAATMGWSAFLRSSLARNLNSYAKSVGIEIPPETQNTFVNRAMAELDKRWLSKQAIKTIFKPSKGVLKVLPETAQQAEADVVALIQREASNFIPKGTQTGAMAFGGVPKEGKIIPKPVTPAPEVTKPSQSEIKDWISKGYTKEDIESLSAMTPELREITTHQARMTGFRDVSREAVDDYLQKVLKLAKSRNNTKAIEDIEIAIEYNNSGLLQNAVIESESALNALHMDEIAELREAQRVAWVAENFPITSKVEQPPAVEPLPQAPEAIPSPAEAVTGVVPPTQPPAPPPTAVTPTPTPAQPSLTQLNKIIEQSQAVVRRDRPGLFTKIIDRIPGIKKMVEFERPGLAMQGENEKILVAHVAEAATRSNVSAQALSTRPALINGLKQAFGVKVGLGGKGAIHGDKTNVKFIGTPQQRNPIVGTIKDIADRPELYELSDAQKAVLTRLNDRNNELLSFVTGGYGAEIGRYPAKEGGAFLPNVDVSKDAVQAIGNEMRAIASGRQKTRFYATASDRMAHDPSFKPELDIEKLLVGMDRAKASAASGQTFRQVLGGKTRLEVMQETHPALATKMEALKKRLISLRGSAGRLDEKLDKAVANFLASPVEDIDLSDVQSALDVKLARGARAGMDIKDIQKEIDGVRAQIKALRVSWEVANLKPYQFVQQGIYRYFPAEQASLIRDLLKVSDNPFLNFIENIRGTAFSGDLSPILGVQTPVGIFADPIGAFTQAGGGLKKAIQAKDPFVSFTVEGLAKDVSKDVAGWSQYFSLSGHVPSGTPQEFAGGFLRMIPGFSKFNESTFILVTRQSKNLYDKTWKSLIKSGLSELDAKVAASTVANEVFPLLNPRKLGQSPARQALLRSLPTSYSFIRQPAELMGNAAKGFAKTATGQQVRAEELIAMKVIMTMAASTMVVSAVSQAIDAQRKGNDVGKAILNAINPDPENGKFASIIYSYKVNGEWHTIRVPVGGMHRALFRAIYPQKIQVGGVTMNIPFAGLPMYLKNRLNPFMRTQIDLLRNEDYYGQKIRKGDVAEQILRTLAYEFEGMIPLTVGASVEAVRTGMPQEEALTQIIGQFAGVNVIESKWYVVQSLRERYSKQDYGKAYTDLNSGEKDDLLRNHTDLKSVYDEAKKELLYRGKDLPKVYAALTEQAVSLRDNSLNNAAQALTDGDISKYQYDSERGYIRPYYSGQRNALWQFKEQLDPEQAKQLEQYFNESSKPEDKALDAYWEHYNKLLEKSELPRDWDAIDTQLTAFINQFPAKIQKYIRDSKDSWIKDLPQPARSIEESRASGIEDGTWWDDYRGTTQRKESNLHRFMNANR